LWLFSAINAGLPELVEGLPSSCGSEKGREGFDRLSQAGVKEAVL
jgi:hypothetical protein